MHEAIKHEDPCAKRLANVVRQVQVSRFGYIGEGGIKLFFCLFFLSFIRRRNRNFILYSLVSKPQMDYI